ncbi:MAG: tRNA (adenosine(37)-N6)-threonylcarbamoyltransferase complex ATPase subunit type 1 TsaE [Cytophagales bacterium]|nr:tRNA (adenosine(37)-N6)-threonylcarbamoyltransferase complex ATPase subunit type 1 TsaE [Cytophagales bacterium]
MNTFSRTYSLEQLDDVAEDLLAFSSGVTVLTFIGNLGAGKTTLIKELFRQLGVEQNVQSPTFSIVNSYLLDYENELFHFDCYRLKNKEEALDFGIEEYLDSGNLCFIEWPQVIEELLPKPWVEVNIETLDDMSRTITAKIIN